MQESFFSTLKLELDHDHWGTVEALELGLFSYIGGFYNTRRLHSSRVFVSPHFKQMLLDSRGAKISGVE